MLQQLKLGKDKTATAELSFKSASDEKSSQF